MAQQLVNTVAFTNLVTGVAQSLPHGLNVNGVAVVPDLLEPSARGFTVTADVTNITVTKTSASGDAVSVLAVHWYSAQRSFGSTNPPPGSPPFEGSLSPQPFVANISETVLGINVRDYGAVGDGITDDSAAIQAAIDAVDADFGNTVWFPAGRYRVESEIVVAKSSVMLRGLARYGNQNVANNRGSTLVLGANIAGAMIRFAEAGGSASQGCGVQDLAFSGWVYPYGAGDQRAFTAEAAVYVEDSHRFFLKDCDFSYLNARALWTEFSVRSAFYGADMYRCGAENKPSLDVNERAAGIYTQGSVFNGFKIEVSIDEGAGTTPYMSVSALSTACKFSAFGFEADSALATSLGPFLKVLGDGHAFSDFHCNRNIGTNPVVHSQGQYNTFNNMIFRGDYNATLIDQISSLNVWNNIIAADIVPPGPAAGWIVEISGRNNIFTNIFSTDMPNGVKTKTAAATYNLVKNFRFDTGTTAIDDSSTATPKANRFVDVIVDGLDYGLTTLTSAASVTPDGQSSLAKVYELELTDANVQLENVINTVVGARLRFAIRQDGVGGRVLAFGTAWKFSATAPALPTGSGDEYEIEGTVRAVDGNNVATVILCTRTPALA